LLATVRKNFQTDVHEIFGKGWQWASEQMIKFWWQSRSLSGYRDCFPDLSLIQKVVNGHKSAADTDLPDGSIGETCLGGGMHCLSASSSV